MQSGSVSSSPSQQMLNWEAIKSSGAEKLVKEEDGASEVGCRGQLVLLL